MAKGIHEDALSLEYERLEALALRFVSSDEFYDEVERFITQLLGKPNMPTPEQVLQACKDALACVMMRVALSNLFRKVK